MFLSKSKRAISLAKSLIETLMEREGIPGISVAVSKDGRTVWEEGFGYSDVENMVKMTKDTLVRVGSISKMITTLAVAKMIDDGKLDIDLPIQNYLPNFPIKKWNNQEVTITTRQLMNHTAGFRHYLPASTVKHLLENPRADVPPVPKSIADAYQYCQKNEGSLPPEFYIRKSYQNISESLELFQNDPLIFKPGTNCLYSTFGWIVVSAIVERLAGINFRDHMTSLLRQLGFTNTVFDIPSVIRPNRTRYYSRRQDGNLVNSPFVDCSWKLASGGYLSTVVDLTHLANIMLQSLYESSTDEYGRCSCPIKQKTVRHLWTPYDDAFDEEGPYGLGCVSVQEKVVRQYQLRPTQHVFHVGLGVGFSSVVFITLVGEDLTREGNLASEKRYLTGNINAASFHGATTAMLANFENYNFQHLAQEINDIFISSMDM